MDMVDSTRIIGENQFYFGKVSLLASCDHMGSCDHID